MWFHSAASEVRVCLKDVLAEMAENKMPSLFDNFWQLAAAGPTGSLSLYLSLSPHVVKLRCCNHERASCSWTTANKRRWSKVDFLCGTHPAGGVAGMCCSFSLMSCSHTGCCTTHPAGWWPWGIHSRSLMLLTQNDYCSVTTFFAAMQVGVCWLVCQPACLLACLLACMLASN